MADNYSDAPMMENMSSNMMKTMTESACQILEKKMMDKQNEDSSHDAVSTVRKMMPKGK